MEGRARDSGARHEDGFEFGDRGEDSGASYLNGNFLEESLLLLRRIFKGGGPAGSPRGEAQSFTLAEIDDFDNGTVGSMTDVVSMRIEFFDRGEHFLESLRGPDGVVSSDAEFIQERVVVIF